MQFNDFCNYDTIKLSITHLYIEQYVIVHQNVDEQHLQRNCKAADFQSSDQWYWGHIQIFCGLTLKQLDPPKE